MQSRPSPLALVAVFALGLVVSSVVNRPSVGQAPAAPAKATGLDPSHRYRLTLSNDGDFLFIIDGQTGQTWYRPFNVRNREAWSAYPPLTHDRE